MDLTKDAIELLLQTGRGQQAVIETGSGYFAPMPNSTIADLSEHYPPKFIEQTVLLLDAESFIAYVNRFKTTDSLIFANVTRTGATFEAVLDYHGFPTKPETAEPDYCSHRVKFTTIETPEWEAWKAADRKPMDQVTFATWLEDNLSLFASPEGSGAPSGSDLLELIRTLHGHKNARFNTNLRLNTGAYSVNYDEDVEVKGSIATKSGSLDLPPVIVGGFSIFKGTPAYAVSARLKTRIQDRKLVIFFETIAAHKIIAESVEAVVERIEEKTKLQLLLGTPNS